MFSRVAIASVRDAGPHRHTADPSRLGLSVVLANATGCLEVSTSIFPFTSWRAPWIHNAFENAAATISGAEAMYRSLKRQGKIPPDQEIRFIAFGGTGDL